jgi:hemerythrin-like metal-binding protein
MEDPMTRSLSWHDEWSLNVDVLDTEHRELIEKLSEICDRFGPDASAGCSGNASALIAELTELGDAVREHFRREEDLMKMVGYEGIGEHATEHALLMAEYADLVRHWGTQNIHVLDDDARTSVLDWILDHILGADRDFAKALLEYDEQLNSTRHHRTLAA